MAENLTQRDFGFPKGRRIVDEGLLETVRSLPCLACLAPAPSEAHHVTTRKAGGHDIASNVMSLCPTHHRAWHQDPGRFIRAFRSVAYWLIAAERFDILDRFKVRRPD